MSGDRLSFSIDDAAAGERLDRYLDQRIADQTRSALRRMFLDGRVHVDGQPATKPGQLLKPGASIELELPAAPTVQPQAENISLDVIHEDEQIIVVDKAAGLVVHPGHGRPDGTLVNALLGRGTRLAPTGAPARPGIVHRLDQGTSGLIVVAKSDIAHHALARAFAERRVDKRYLALVWGRPDPESGRIERSIGRSRTNPLKMAVEGTRGRTRVAVTEFETQESLPGFALLRIRLETGRTHQVRVHMQSIRHPVVGDIRYGGRAWRGVQDPIKRKALREFDRLALHAAELSFDHPVSGERLHFRAPLPTEFHDLLQVLRRTR